MPNSPIEIARHIPDRFKKPTDQELNGEIRKRGINYLPYVSCSVTDTMQAQWEEWDRNPSDPFRAIMAADESHLPAIAAGIYVGSGGRERALMHMQNSGYGYALDGITSVLAVFGIEAGLIVTGRGIDPQDNSIPHRNIGSITDRMTRLWFDKHSIFGRLDGRGLRGEWARGLDRFANGNDALIRLSPMGFDKTYPMPQVGPREYTSEDFATRMAQLDETRERILAVQKQKPVSREEGHDIAMENVTPNTVVVTGNGFDPRALFSRYHRELNVYGIGGMGLAVAFALGGSIVNPHLNWLVLQGDQNAQHGHNINFLMELYQLPNLKVVTFDNGHGTSVGSATSLPLMNDNFLYSDVIRTIPEQPGTFKSQRLEDGIPSHYASEGEMIATLGPMRFQIKRVMHMVNQITDGTTGTRLPSVFTDAYHK